MPAQRGNLVKTPIPPGVTPQLRNINKYNQAYAQDPTLGGNLSQEQVQQVQQHIKPFGYQINQTQAPTNTAIHPQAPQVIGSILHPTPTFATRM